MLARAVKVGRVVKGNFHLWLLITVSFTLFYYLALLFGLMVRFRDLPNYANLYDWWGSVEMILTSTPSWRDSVLIIKDEWLLEIGFMNYDYGVGISEWSLFLAPVKVLGIFLLGAVMATNYLLIRHNKSSCSLRVRLSTEAATGLGATLVALASITLSWVVCCSTPTWVVGLAMMGLGVSASLWLEPAGPWINALGFTSLLVAMFVAASPPKRSHTAI